MGTAMTGSGPAGGRVLAVRSGVVPALAAGFTGRPETASGLAGALVPGTVAALANSEPGQQAVSCGKTQLAVHAAESLWRLGRVELLAWVDASSRASLLAGYLQAAAAVGIEPAGPAEQVAGRLTTWLATTPRPWLLVLDDLRDGADLEGLCPHGPAGAVVITTRDKDTVSDGPGVRVVPVGALSTREALNYLMECLADDPDQRHGAIDLAIALGGDPCALTHASALIATTTQTCAHYQRRYTDKLASLAARQADGTPAGPVAATWVLSAERAGQLVSGGATSLLLALTALLDGQPVPGPVFTTSAACGYLTHAGGRAMDPDRAWETVRVLAHTGLLTVDTTATPPPVRLSRAVAAHVRAATPKQVFAQAAQAAADALLETWPAREPSPWQAAAWRSCADALLRTAGDRLWANDACHPLLLKAGHSLEAAQLTGPAARHWTQLTTLSDTILGPAHPDTLTAGSHLAHALLAAGQPGEAVTWWQWVAAARTRTSGADHPGTLAARVNLGHALAAAGETTDAVTVLEQSLAACERACGPGHPETLQARAELAAACQATGQPAAAIGHRRRILAEHERAHGPHHVATITARENLASACLVAGRHKDAISGYKTTLADRRRTLGGDHPATVAAQQNLAAAYQAAGKIAAALQQHEQACAGYERILGATHRDTLTCRAGLASAYHAAGRLTDAAALLRDTLTCCEQALPPGDPLTVAVQQTLTRLAGQ
jgi:tetratricopeptide (TPR) repeat protein